MRLENTGWEVSAEDRLCQDLIIPATSFISFPASSHASAMLHPVTHAKNANQHPGQIILDTKQKHCTIKQKQQDDARNEQNKNQQKAAQACVIEWVAEAVIKGTEAERCLLTTHHRAPLLHQTGGKGGM